MPEDVARTPTGVFVLNVDGVKGSGKDGHVEPLVKYLGLIDTYGEKSRGWRKKGNHNMSVIQCFGEDCVVVACISEGGCD